MYKEIYKNNDFNLLLNSFVEEIITYETKESDIFEDFLELTDHVLFERNRFLVEEVGLELKWATPIEYSSPKIRFSPKNLLELKKFLLEIKEIMTFDENCAFHIHFSFPIENIFDYIWSICKAASSDKFIHMVENMEKFEFYHERFAQDILGDINFALDNDSVEELAFACLGLVNNKTINLQVSKHSTIEWRGPRGFLSEDDKYIGEFISHFYKLLLLFSKLSSETNYIEMEVLNDDGDYVVQKIYKQDLLKKIIDLNHIKSSLVTRKKINESYLNSEFYFGFELEGYIEGAVNQEVAANSIALKLENYINLSGGSFSLDRSLEEFNYSEFKKDKNRFQDYINYLVSLRLK